MFCVPLESGTMGARCEFWTCSAASVGSRSGCTGPDSARPLSVRLTLSAGRSWQRGSPESPFTRTSVPCMERSIVESTWCAEVSPVKTSLLPEKVSVCPASVPASGSRCSASSTGPDPDGSWLRTSVLSSLGEQTSCSLVWKKQATPSGRPWWVLGQSGPRKTGSGSGLWPTPTRADGIRDTVETYMGGDLTLYGACVNRWPTPSARDWKDSGREPAAQNRKSPNLPAAVVIFGREDPENPGIPENPRALLNPRWVSLLMGYPEDWLSVPSETPSSRKS